MIQTIRLECWKADLEMLELNVSAKINETAINKNQVLGPNTIVAVSNKICIFILIFKEVGNSIKKRKVTALKEMI